MSITRDNCEALFLDYYEGNLSKEGVEELFAFLMVNPDLQEVFDSYENISFEPEGKFEFENKSSLKKDVPQQTNNISESNYTAWFVSYVEGLLNEKETALVNAFVAANPAKERELELLKKSVLKADDEKFENKEALKKSILITAENFEEYAVLAMDGELSEKAQADFNAYLNTHPATRNTYNSLLATKLSPEKEIVFEQKDALRKKAVVITAENFEEYAVLAMDEELNTIEATAFTAYTNAQPATRNAYATLLATKLIADENIIFPDKESLKRKDRKGFMWWREMSFAAAAVVALIVGLYFWNNRDTTSSDGNHNLIAKHDVDHTPKNKTIDSVPAPIVKDHSQDPQIADVNVPKKKNHMKGSDTTGVHLLPHNNSDRVALATFPSRNSVQQLPTDYYTSVDFSDALYNDESYGSKPAGGSNSISLGQYAMRWMKKKLDVRSNNETNDDQDGDLYAYAPTKTTGDVSGFDLTKSAVDRLAYATGSNVHLAKNDEGTVLSVWKYDVVLSRN